VQRERIQLVAFAVTLLSTIPLIAQHSPVNRGNWGTVTTPLVGTSESGVYSGAELFAGPNKFGSYYKGVLPNGRVVKPAGNIASVVLNF